MEEKLDGETPGLGNTAAQVLRLSPAHGGFVGVSHDTTADYMYQKLLFLLRMGQSREVVVPLGGGGGAIRERQVQHTAQTM